MPRGNHQAEAAGRLCLEKIREHRGCLPTLGPNRTEVGRPPADADVNRLPSDKLLNFSGPRFPLLPSLAPQQFCLPRTLVVYSAPWCEVLRNLSSVFQQLMLDAGYLKTTPFLQANVRILQSDYLHLKEKQIIKQTSKSPRRLVLGGEVRREELMPRYSTRKQSRGLIPRPPLAGSPGVDKSRRPGIPV